MKIQKSFKLLLLILPIYFVILSFYQKSEITNYHMYNTDPEYAYLLNGLNICNLSTPAQIIGPGTPSQMISAITIRVLHSFRATNDSLNVDVLKNPDVYCSAIQSSTSYLIALALLIAGLIISLATKNLISGILFQLMPFTKWILLEINSRILVEDLVILGVIILLALAIRYIHEQRLDTKKILDKYVLGFAIIIGFIASSKLVYLPIALIPFLLLEGGKRKTAYTILSIVAFFTFSFPLFFNWVPFRDWYISNFFHSGMYGAGKSTIIDYNTFITNLNFIFGNNNIYLITFIASTIFPIFYYVPILKLKRDDDREFRALIGIILTSLILTTLVSKQYKEYYLTVNFLLIVPSWYFMLRILSRSIKIVSFKYVQIVAFFILSYFVWINGPKLVYDYHPIRMEKDLNYVKSLHYVENNFDPSDPILVLSNYYGSPFKEYGIFFGLAWCGSKMSNVYATDLIKLYPNIYIYHGWNNLFNQWGTSNSFIDLMKRYGTVVFFSGDPSVENSLNSKLHGINRQLDMSWSTMKKFEKLNQTFYEVKFDTMASMINEYGCDAEVIDSTSANFINHFGQVFDGAKYQNDDFSKSGEHSVKILKDQFGYTCSLSEVQKGEHYSIDIWRYRNRNENSALVIQSANSGEFYTNTTKTNSIDGDWEKLSLDFVVPENMHNKEVKIYCWNFDETKPAYFDDFMIRKLE